MQFDGNASNLPKRSELPQSPDAPAGAAWIWGKDDEVLHPQRAPTCHRPAHNVFGDGSLGG